VWREGRVVEKWMKERDLLIEETLTFVQRVVAAKPVRIETSTPIRRAESVIKPNLPKPKDRLFEREEIRQRVADFKATQLKFEREREEYFKRTLAKVRSGSLTIPKRLPALKVENRNQQGRSPWEQ
jgi:hypothetical protein